MSRVNRPLAAILISTLIWAVTPIIIKTGLQEIPPFSFAFVRFGFASLLILPVIFYRKGENITNRDFGLIVLFAFLLSAHISLALLALNLTNITSLAVLMSLGPLFVSTASIIYLKEKAESRFYLGALFSTIGALVVVFNPDSLGPNPTNILIGNIILLFSLLATTIFTVTSKKMVQKYSPLTFMGLIFPLACAFLLPFLFYEAESRGNWLAHLSSLSVLSVLYATLFASLIAYLLYEWGLKGSKVHIAGTIGFLEPIIATILAVIIFGEKVTPVFIFGALMIGLGVAVATLHLPHHRHSSHKY